MINRYIEVTDEYIKRSMSDYTGNADDDRL